MTIVSRGALEELGEAQYGLTPVGTGPFRVTGHQLGQSVVLERFADYYDPDRPKLDKVTITPIIDAEPLAAAIEAGDIQLIGGNPIAPEIVDRFLDNPDLVVSIVPGPTFQSVWMNPWREPFAVADFNKPLEELMQEKGFKVRLAIAKALDRERYIEQAQFGRGTPAYGTINPAMGFFFDPGLGETSNQRFDLEEAKRLLAEAGYPDGEGIPPLKIMHTPDQRREVQVIANILKTNLGIELELDTKDFPVLIDEFDKMNWDLVRLGSGGDYDPDDGLVDWMQTTSKFNGRLRDKDKMRVRLLLRHPGRRADRSAAPRDRSRASARRWSRRPTRSPPTRWRAPSCSTRWTSWSITTRSNFPPESRIPGLVDLDRTTVS